MWFSFAENIATVVGMEADMTLAEEFSPELENPSSPQFQNLSRNVEAAVCKIYAAV